MAAASQGRDIAQSCRHCSGKACRSGISQTHHQRHLFIEILQRPSFFYQGSDILPGQLAPDRVPEKLFQIKSLFTQLQNLFQRLPLIVNLRFLFFCFFLYFGFLLRSFFLCFDFLSRSFLLYCSFLFRNLRFPASRLKACITG